MCVCVCVCVFVRVKRGGSSIYGNILCGWWQCVGGGSGRAHWGRSIKRAGQVPFLVRVCVLCILNIDMCVHVNVCVCVSKRRGGQFDFMKIQCVGGGSGRAH